MWLTIISALLTLISIVCSVISIRNAKRARDNKNEVINLKNAIEVKEIAEKYKEAHLKFLQDTRGDNWYKGKNINSVVSPLEDVLATFASVYPLMNDSSDLKRLVNRVLSDISQFDKCSKEEKKNTYTFMGDIENMIQEELWNQTTKAVR